jgi:hypothetical protein
MEQTRCTDGRRNGSQGLDDEGPSRIAERGTSGTWDPRKHLGHPRLYRSRQLRPRNPSLRSPFSRLYTSHHYHTVITAQHNRELNFYVDDEINACTDETDRRCNEPSLTIDYLGYGFLACEKWASVNSHRFPSDSRYLIPFSGLSFRRSEHQGEPYKLSKLSQCTLSRFFQGTILA